MGVITREMVLNKADLLIRKIASSYTDLEFVKHTTSYLLSLIRIAQDYALISEDEYRTLHAKIQHADKLKIRVTQGLYRNQIGTVHIEQYHAYPKVKVSLYSGNQIHIPKQFVEVLP